MSNEIKKTTEIINDITDGLDKVNIDPSKVKTNQEELDNAKRDSERIDEATKQYPSETGSD